MEQTQALRVIQLGRAGLTIDEIKRTIAREFHCQPPNARMIKSCLKGAGIGDDQEARLLEDLSRYTEDATVLRKRWAAKLPEMRARLRAEIGGV